MFDFSVISGKGVTTEPTTLRPGQLVLNISLRDLAVGHYVHQRAKSTNRTLEVPDFFGETIRW